MMDLSDFMRLKAHCSRIANYFQYNRQLFMKKQKGGLKNGGVSRFKMPISEYSQLYCKYMREEYPAVDLMIKRLIQMPCCQQYYLKFPLESLLRGVVKKLMLNSYEMGVYGYFLEHIDSWMMPGELYLNVSEVFPDVIHVNQPSSQSQLKQLSLFLYFSSFSIKQLLNSSLDMYKHQMKKLFPEFEHLHTHWVNNQPTVNMILSPKCLNEYFKKIEKLDSMIDYNTCVDKIIQISPCYDLSSREKKEFGQQKEYNFQHTGFVKLENLDDDMGGYDGPPI